MAAHASASGEHVGSTVAPQPLGSTRAPEQEQAGEHPPISPRTLAHARAARRRVLSHQTLRDRWENPFDVPMGAREVFRAASQLVVIDGDGLEYRPDLEVGGPQTLVQRLTRRAKVLGAEVEVAEHLRTLVWMQLLRLTEEGALRLGVDCRPKARTRAPGAASAAKPVSERKRAANISNSRSRWNRQLPEGQGTILMPLAGGSGGSKEPVEPSGRRQDSAPCLPDIVGSRMGSPDATAASGVDAAVDVVGSRGGWSVGSEPQPSPADVHDAPGLSSSSLAAAAASKEDSTHSLACTAAAAKEAGLSAVLEPRAGAGADANKEPTLGPTEAANVHLVALDVSTILKIDGRRGSPGAVLVATWLSLGLPRETILTVARRRMAANEEKVQRGLAAPVGSFDFLNDAMYEAAGLEPPSKHMQLVPATAEPSPLAASPTNARSRRDILFESGRKLLDAALDALSKGDDISLQRHIARMHQSEPRALQILLDENPAARVLYERMRSASGTATR